MGKQSKQKWKNGIERAEKKESSMEIVEVWKLQRWLNDKDVSMLAMDFMAPHANICIFVSNLQLKAFRVESK